MQPHWSTAQRTCIVNHTVLLDGSLGIADLGSGCSEIHQLVSPRLYGQPLEATGGIQIDIPLGSVSVAPSDNCFGFFRDYISTLHRTLGSTDSFLQNSGLDLEQSPDSFREHGRTWVVAEPSYCFAQLPEHFSVTGIHLFVVYRKQPVEHGHFIGAALDSGQRSPLVGELLPEFLTHVVGTFRTIERHPDKFDGWQFGYHPASSSIVVWIE